MKSSMLKLFGGALLIFLSQPPMPFAQNLLPTPGYAITYQDPQQRFVISFPSGWQQAKPPSPEAQAYFSYTQNGAVIAEAIVYSYQLPHQMNVSDFQSAIFQKTILPHINTMTPDPASNSLKNFGMTTSLLSEYDYNPKTPMRMRHYYFVHVYTATGIVIRFDTFKQYWPMMIPKFEEVMATFKIGISNITLEQLAEQNLVAGSVTPPLLQNPKAYMPDYPWDVSPQATPYDEEMLINIRVLKNLVQNDPTLKSTLPEIEKREKEVEQRIQNSLEKNKRKELEALHQKPGEGPLPKDSAVSTVLNVKPPANLTGDIYGEIQKAPPRPTPEETQIAVEADLVPWQDPLERFSLIYPKGWAKTQKGAWYLSFDGPEGNQILVLSFMDPSFSAEYLKQLLKNQPPLAQKEVTLKNAEKAQMLTFQTRNEESPDAEEMIVTSISPEKSNLLFLIRFSKERYEGNRGMVKKIIEVLIAGIELKG
ncbi:MAG: hypothetical protein HYS08_02595 [Chlamydiae bacterium]|nr:hypothetical protein [Chlamydiota bacterium]MBI3266619.1 hypothetical protein [Chlamydiota bacterium]